MENSNKLLLTLPKTGRQATPREDTQGSSESQVGREAEGERGIVGKGLDCGLLWKEQVRQISKFRIG